MWNARSLCLLALLAAALISPSHARAAGPSLTPRAPGVAAGSVLLFAAEGFTPGERVAIWATAPSQAVLGGDPVTADAGGSAEVSFRAPAGAAGGTWALTAYGLESRTPAVARFEVTGGAGAGEELFAAAAPESGPAGSTFSFAATGFERRERVSYWFTAPDGTVFAAFSQAARANRDGRVDITWDVPADAPRGAWVVTLQGIRSGAARGIAFSIR